jgi:uncharacterized protein YggE
MNRVLLISVLFSVLISPRPVSAQEVQVNRENRAIELQMESSIEVQADLVSITVGYHNFGPTYEVAYAENMRVADQILKAWTSAGVPEDQISTHSLSLSRVSDSDQRDMDVTDRKEKQFEATQSWAITAKTEVAQKLVDIALAAGANEVDDPVWELSDPNAAEGKAYLSALEKARGIAGQMARSFGAKVGALLYASNQARVISFVTRSGSAGYGLETLGSPSRIPPPPHPVKLLPQKIEKKATVRAIFALE